MCLLSISPIFQSSTFDLYPKLFKTLSSGTTGDSYDNALAEIINGLYKSEMIEYLKEQWHGVNDVELATLEWVDWFNKTRLHSTIGYVSPFEFEKQYYDNLILSGVAA